MLFRSRATGAGKTSVVSLLVRFYEAERGQVLLDGRDVREFDPEVLRRRLTDAGLKGVRVEKTAERPAFRSGQEMWDWVLYSNPISGMLVADLNEEQQARIRQVLDGMLRERSGGNGPALLTNPVNIGIGTK